MVSKNEHCFQGELEESLVSITKIVKKTNITFFSFTTVPWLTSGPIKASPIANQQNNKSCRN